MAVLKGETEFSPTSPMRPLPRPQGFKVVSTAIGQNGDAIRLLVSDSSTFPKIRLDGKHPAIILSSDEYGDQEFQLPSQTAEFPIVQIFPNGEILTVSARCRLFKDGSHELNANVYGANGILEIFGLAISMREQLAMVVGAL